MRMIREKEAKEIAKKQQKEIAKKQKLDAKMKKDHPEEFEDKGFSQTSEKETPKPKPKEETKALVGRGMQLGKPKKLQNDSGFGKGFGIDDEKTSFFASKEETKQEPEVVEQEQQKVNLHINEIVN